MRTPTSQEMNFYFDSQAAQVRNARANGYRRKARRLLDNMKYERGLYMKLLVKEELKAEIAAPKSRFVWLKELLAIYMFFAVLIAAFIEIGA